MSASNGASWHNWPYPYVPLCQLDALRRMLQDGPLIPALFESFDLVTELGGVFVALFFDGLIELQLE